MSWRTSMTSSSAASTPKYACAVRMIRSCRAALICSPVRSCPSSSCRALARSSAFHSGCCAVIRQPVAVPLVMSVRKSTPFTVPKPGPVNCAPEVSWRTVANPPEPLSVTVGNINACACRPRASPACTCARAEAKVGSRACAPSHADTRSTSANAGGVMAKPQASMTSTPPRETRPTQPLTREPRPALCIDIAVLDSGRSRARRDTELPQDDLRRTPPGEPALQQVHADERREEKPPGTHEQRALGGAQGQRDEDQRACKDADDLPRSHDVFSENAAGLRRLAT